jgi:hypothetical protein
MITAGRPVTRIVTENSNEDMVLDLRKLRAYFGSNRPLRSVEWTNCARPEDLIQYILDQNPEIQDLKITLPRFEPYPRVSLHEICHCISRD